MGTWSLAGTGTLTERLSLFWAVAWRAIVCFITLTYLSVVVELTLAGRMTFPEMWKQGRYVRWIAMMLVGAFITYGSPMLAAHWLLRRTHPQRAAWPDTARLWWAFTWRFWLPIFAVRFLVLKLVLNAATSELLTYAISLPLASWLAGGGVHRVIVDDISARCPGQA